MSEETVFYLELLGACAWLVFIGPLWLACWGILHATKALNRAASIIARILLFLLPTPGLRRP